MNNFSRYWIFFIMMLLIGGAIAWFWYKPPLSTLNKFLPENFSDLAAKADDLIRDLKNKGDSTAKSFIDNIAEKPKDIATDVVKEIKQSAISNTKEGIAQVFGLTASGIIPKNIAIVSPISQGISLFMESDASGMNYAVQWGDEESTSGFLDAKQQKTLDHNWKLAGDYVVNVDIENISTKEKKSFAFPVKIIK